ncbi:hypothetical protein KPATCC21470_3388 [Kitasatospora purpeofusca]
MRALSEAPERNAGTECPGCLYFDGIAAQYPADVNPTIARHLVRWRQRHADDGECENPEVDSDE